MRRLAVMGTSAALLFAVTLCSVGASAQGEPIAVVVEAGGTRVDPSRMRAWIAEAIEGPAIPLTDAAAANSRGTLTIAIERDGRRASVQYRPSEGVDYAVLLEVRAGDNADRAGQWLVAPAASAIHSAERWVATRHLATELMDPWLQYRVDPRLAGEVSYRLPPEVIDPFVGSPPRRVHVELSDFYLGDEVLDPWARYPNGRPEDGHRLTPPTPSDDADRGP